MRNRIVLLLPALVIAGCATDAPELSFPVARPVTVPAGAGAAQPFVAASDDGLLVSWTEPADSGHALRFARWAGDGWSAPAQVAQGRDWFVNWADFPSVIDLGNGRLAAHWLQRSGAGAYAYDVRLSTSADGGATWSEPVTPHSDGTSTEHGFVSLYADDGGVGAVWLDGRMYASGADHDAGGHGSASDEMMLRFTTLGADGVALPDDVVDSRVCDCCQTDVAVTSRGPLVVYRDRSAGEVRDIFISRRDADGWTAPRPVHADNWVIDACPVNGPQADAEGEDVVVAWFAAPSDSARVSVAFSDDAGDTFGAPVRIDDGNPLGRVDVVLLGGRRALVVWLEQTGEAAELRGRVVTAERGPGGPAAVAGPGGTLSATTSRRSGGFPRLARHGEDVLLLWNAAGDSAGISGAVLNFGGA